MQFEQPTYELKIFFYHQPMLILLILQRVSFQHHQKPLTDVPLLELKLIHGQLDQNCHDLWSQTINLKSLQSQESHQVYLLRQLKSLVLPLEMAKEVRGLLLLFET